MTTTPLRPSDLYHTGLVFEDVEAATQRLGAAGGYTFTPTIESEIKVRLASGTTTLGFAFAYSLEAPHIEIVRAVPGTLWTPAARNAPHHLGYWVDDVAATCRQMTEAGYELEACAEDDSGEPTSFAYFISPDGIRLEVVDRAALGNWSEFLAQFR